mmetsp:Transcript_101406/g.293293  ORF Transcript_101406/g.293293 Transcript_101406/m.293293 type:complete len:250 (-) Transcript_101406:1654-2403(-)
MEYFGSSGSSGRTSMTNSMRQFGTGLPILGSHCASPVRVSFVAGWSPRRNLARTRRDHHVSGFTGSLLKLSRTSPTRPPDVVTLDNIAWRSVIFPSVWSTAMRAPSRDCFGNRTVSDTMPWRSCSSGYCTKCLASCQTVAKHGRNSAAAFTVSNEIPNMPAIFSSSQFSRYLSCSMARTVSADMFIDLSCRPSAHNLARPVKPQFGMPSLGPALPQAFGPRLRVGVFSWVTKWRASPIPWAASAKPPTQ